MSDEKQRQQNDLAKLREASEKAAAQLPADDAGNPNSPDAIKAHAATAKSTYKMGDVATAEWRALAHEEFKKLREAKAKANYPHTQKMIDTIVALVDARIAGHPETPVFDRPDTCSATTYHTTWKHDKDFTDCLNNVTAFVRDWHDGRALRALEEAAEKLALAAPIAVGKAISLIGYGDASIALRAAFGVLDRAGVQTSTKQGGEMLQFLDKLMDKLDLDKLSTDQMERIVAGEHPFKVLLDEYLTD